MKLSLVFELLLIFILLAFAASKSVKKQHNNRKSIQNRDDGNQSEESAINKYCKCQEAFCSCCRDFAVDVVNINGPGCATLMYLDGDKMSVSLSFGKKVITNRTLSNRKPSPVCMPLPGGISKFCGRVYNIARAGEEFRACLGLELQAKKTVEAAVRVSCFKFGPRGVTSEPADPLPLVPQSEQVEDDDDDDDDDDEYGDDLEEDDDAFGIGIDEDDDDDDEDDDDDDGGLELVKEADGVSDDYAGFPGLEDSFFDELFSSGSGKKKSNKNKKKQAPAPSSTTTTTKRPRPTRRPTRRPNTRTTTLRPIRTTTVRIRPVNRRPTRRPSRRPANGTRPQRRTTTEKTTTTVSSTSTTPSPIVLVSEEIQTNEPIQIENVVSDQVSEIADIVVQNQEPILIATTEKSVLNFDDPTLEMSLAHVTGQLSSLHATPLLPNNEVKETEMPPKEPAEMNYEKVETITAKAPSTVSFTSTTEESINDNLIQIVQSLDSESEEVMPSKDESVAADESRGDFNRGFHYPGFNTQKKKNRNQDFALADIDVLDLTQIGESIGDQIGVFGGGKRRNHGNKQHRIRGGKGDGNDYDDILDTLSDALIMRKSDTGSNVRKDRRRQNKMMRGEW